MGMDLFTIGREEEEDGYFRFGISAWEKMLELAEAYGWEPAGTVINHTAMAAQDTSPQGNVPTIVQCDDNARGDYWTNDGSIVTAADANALADAIERALRSGFRVERDRPYVPPKRTLERLSLPLFLKLLQGSSEFRFLGNVDPEMPPEEVWRDHDVKLRNFVGFCRQGAFAIH